MRIGIDCRTILNTYNEEMTGIGHYTYYLVKHLLSIDQENEYVLFFDNKFSQKEQFMGPKIKIVKLPFYQYKKYLPLAYSQMLISAFFAREKLDLLHAPANIIPLFYNWPAVVTIHDLAIYKFPEFFPGNKIIKQPLATKILVPNTINKAKKIIAVSQNTKKDIIDIFGVPEEKIQVVYEGVISHGKNCPNQADFATVSKHYEIKEKYLLFIGSLEPRKNIINLVKAFKNYKLIEGDKTTGLQLILVGGKGWKNDKTFKVIQEANEALFAKEKDKPIKYLGYLPLAEKLSLIAHALAFIFPSFYEGFGLPVLEAFSCGCPVLASSGHSLEEVGKEAAVYFDPKNITEISKKIKDLFTSEDARLHYIKLGFERVKDYSWEKTASSTGKILLGLQN